MTNQLYEYRKRCQYEYDKKKTFVTIKQNNYMEK